MSKSDVLRFWSVFFAANCELRRGGGVGGAGVVQGGHSNIHVLCNRYDIAVYSCCGGGVGIHCMQHASAMQQ